MLTTPSRIEDPARRSGYALAVVLILLISTALRLWQLSTPSEMMFDEIYYAKDGKAIVDGRVGIHGQYRWAAGDEVSWPHPEMGKLAIAAGIAIFGNDAFGWRFPAVLAGVAILACVYPLGRRLGLSPPWALLGLLFAAADPLGITQSRIATLDVFVAVWTVLCVYLVLRYVQDGWRTRWLFAAGAAGGMALATKWSGALALIAAALIVLATWLIQRHAARAAASVGDTGVAEHDLHADVPSSQIEPAGIGDVADVVPCETQPPPSLTEPRAPTSRATVATRVALAVLALVAVPVAIYMLSYTQYFLAGHTWADFVELHRQMEYFNTHLHATHTYASVAPSWIIDYRPVWYYFDGKSTYYGVIAIGNPFLWWLATLSLAAAVVLALRRRSYTLLPIAALIVVLYVPWFLTTRTSFLYYMTPVAPFLAILVAAALSLFAGEVVPRRGWWAVGAAALAAALLWQPLGIAAGWLFWTLPRHLGDFAGWLGVAFGVVIAVGVLAFLLSRRMRAWRPWMAMVVAGLVIGIVVAFVPIVLGLPISPKYFEHIMWFPSWI